MRSCCYFSHTIRSLILASLILLSAVASVCAQQQATDGATPLGLSPGAPAGSYSLSDFEDVNLFNGTLNFSLPLVKIAGRGQAGYSLMLRIDHKWLVQKEAYDGQPPVNIYTPQPSWWTDTGWAPVYSMGRLETRQGGSRDFVLASGGCGYIHRLTLTRLTFTAPNGTEYELRDQATNGQPVLATCTAYNRGTVFVTADGSAATFVSDTNLFDYQYDNPGNIPPSGYMMLRDGTRFRVDAGNVTWMRDRNGNKLTFSYDIYQRMTAVTDSLNRQVTINYTAGSGAYQEITFKGFGGATRSLKVYFAALSTVLRSDFTLLTTGQMFPELNGAGSGYHNPTVVSAVELPNGKQYQFRYNSYAELTRVVLPTGGAIEYDYAAGLTDSATGSGVVSGLAEKHVYRRAIERRVYPDGGSGSGFASRTTYSRPETSTTNAGYVTTDQYNASGTLLTRSRHYFYGSPRDSFFKQPTEYPAWTDSREYKTEAFAADGTTLLRRVEQTWQQRASVSWWTGGASTAPPNDVRIAETVTTLADTNQMSKQTFGYDDTVPFNNQNSVKEYDYGSGAVGPLVRETRTTYLTSSTYTGTGVHIRDLQSQVSIYDGGGVERSRTTFEYDNYATDANHAALTSRSSISGFDSAFNTSYTTRGNPTGTTKYLLSTSGSISSYMQYDIAGNMIRTIDPRGYVAELYYTDCFGAPNGEARTNTAPAELSGLSSYAFVTSVKNSLNQLAYSQFDFYLGAPVDGEDLNGVVASGTYNDVLDRPTQVRRAAGTAITNQTTFSYDDTNRVITTFSDRDTNNDNLLVNSVLYDQMGRTIETRQYEGGTNYIATQSQYDALGRLYKVSYPFSPWRSETAVWTTTAYDALSRTLSVTTPDSAAVSTSYSGNSVTVTDQALKKRKSVTDALGRLREVYEDPNGLNYQTSYNYDVLDSLVQVTQGSQQRYFMYDSLKRLIRARNPEQSTNATLALSDPISGNSAWSVGYQYDANGNLTQKTDARGVKSTYAYDALNRNTTIDYSDTASINPDVTRFYDGATNGKGRFWYFYSGGDFSNGSNVEATAIDSYDQMGRPLVKRQLSKLNGVWGTTYQTTRTYNLAGGVTSQTYPSGHTVSYAYDAAGRTTSFSGNLGDGVSRTYASSFVYNSRNQVTQELFGTQTPLYHKLQYNIRGQLWDVRVSTGSDVNGSWNRGCLQFFYESTLTHGASGPDNNGNVLKASHYVPLDDQTTTYAIPYQLYTYDSLNRLSSVADYFLSNTQSNTQQSLQSYTYDRWGNRTINAGQTWGTGINNKQFTVDTATNRLGVPSGQSGAMTYDTAGNLITDTYTGVGSRTYDAENRMTTAADNTGQTSRYTYDADGHRVRRQVASSQEEWQIYGIDGELIAEYQANAPASAPEKEYGYRDGQLLITATGRLNVALAANGAVATASSTATGSGFSTTGAINGNYRGPWGNGEGWNDNTPNAVPDWLQVDFAGSKTIDEIDVFSLHDNYTQENTPTTTQTFTLYGLLAFDVQYWNGSSWSTVPGGSVTGNNKVWRKFTFSPITTNKIRVTINAVPDSWSRVVEIQAFGTSAGGEKVQWLVPDHLGTPRIILDQTGSMAGVKRHDYLPFGEELFAGTGGRTTTQGYSGDGIRQQFTQKERDVETGLDYFAARYYTSTQGRFTGSDPYDINLERQLTVDREEAEDLFSNYLAQPQHWNHYVYALNNPLRYVDPDGNFEYETELLGKRIKIKISDDLEKTEQEDIKNNLDAAFARINEAADKLTSEQKQAINSLKRIEVRNDINGTFTNPNNGVLNMKDIFAQNEILDFVVIGIIHESFHADQFRRGLSFDDEKNRSDREEEASAFAVDVAERIGLSSEVIKPYKNDATVGHTAPPGPIYIKPPRKKKTP